jgi:uncharacterized membrane protein YkvA (DUF1232 family)
VGRVKEKLAATRRAFKREFNYYRRLSKHPQTPPLAKICFSLALGYALLPFDLIPDFIPVIGHLDDALIVPGLVLLALRLVPEDVKTECRAVQ